LRACRDKPNALGGKFTNAVKFVKLTGQKAKQTLLLAHAILVGCDPLVPSEDVFWPIFKGHLEYLHILLDSELTLSQIDRAEKLIEEHHKAFAEYLENQEKVARARHAKRANKLLKKHNVILKEFSQSALYDMKPKHHYLLHFANMMRK